ncbi:DUF2971 domain-containing protein [Sediminispirochaeta bajacaliforniensis]|uniref:DUF2971 domain-containing protein n=1 Tax=Sediminispirochaeta bajacaliforniensis TaxID=148 RepID=UPI00146F8F58|nr:DUF2971 domain-containing protein [Sediminispirochaeta bajacaliforniensis]
MNLDDPFERRRYRNYSDWVPQIPQTAPAAKYLGYFNSRVDLTNILCFFDNVNKRNETVQPLTDLKMWSHYGKSHKGCCIVVNKEKTIDAFKKDVKEGISDYGKVEYNELKNYEHVLMSSFDQDGYKDMVFKHLFHSLFFNKATYYSGENEYRFVINNDNQGFAIEIQPLVERIVIAENAAETDIKSIIALCKLFKFEVGKMVVSNDKIEYRQIAI